MSHYQGGSLHLFGSHCCLAPLFSAQNQNFGPSLVMVPSVVWLQSASCSKSTFWVVPSLIMVPSLVWLQSAFYSKSAFWVVPFTFYGSQWCLAPTCFPLKIQHFRWFPSLLWFPVLFFSNVFSAQNQYFGWFFVLFGSKVVCHPKQYFGWLIPVLCLWLPVLFGLKISHFFLWLPVL